MSSTRAAEGPWCAHDTISRMGLLFALGDDLDVAVGPVLDPAGDPEPARLALCSGPEEDAGHPAANDDVHALRRHRLHACVAKLRSEGNFPTAST